MQQELNLECLLCERRSKCIEDPKNQSRIDEMIKEIDDGLKRLKKIADTEARVRLRESSRELKERNRKFGNAPPSSLFAIGRKKSQ